MIDETAPITGSAYDLNRWRKYKGAVDWKLHSVYFKHEIYRGYWKHNGKATSMYGSMRDGMLVIGGNLDTIKECVKLLVVNE